MKRSFVFLIFFSAVLSAYSQTTTAEEFKRLNWLVGEWNRTNVKPGRTGIEKWVSMNSSELQGWGIHMKGADTTFVEKTKLIVKDNNIYYVADVPENKEPVYFKVIKLSDNEFVCENLQHDFPKQIAYVRDGSKLKATISGNGKAIDFLFERKL